MNRILLAACAALLVTAGNAAGQQGCTYDTCALRVQAATFTTPPKLVRGLAGEEIVPLGLLQPALAPLMVHNDSARYHAERYDVLFDQGSIISLVGTGMAIVAPILFKGTSQKITFTVAGIGIGMVGGVIVNRAQEALARAVWWYNRDLAR